MTPGLRVIFELGIHEMMGSKLQVQAKIMVYLSTTNVQSGSVDQSIALTVNYGFIPKLKHMLVSIY